MWLLLHASQPAKDEVGHLQIVAIHHHMGVAMQPARRQGQHFRLAARDLQPIDEPLAVGESLRPARPGQAGVSR
ncbi:hypothetical protein [Azotobacter vinelandii]|uniref:hypothetical protein n=1 Tax=Azotobacter vinelandii TaxID=354 RepID=UPI002666CDE1|nr:hypothetical protein [Azotobacter vinelandii]WKN24346.1 hypothetical protein AVAEIV_002510 [Azotobacter vinelandii]